MTNPQGNPHIAEHGRNTQFGMASACTKSVAKKRAAMSHSVRHALRVACGKPIIDLDAPQFTREMALSLFGYKRGDRLSPAQLIAVQLIFKAMSGNLSAMQRIEVMIDGKP